jgi:hypothetical protein
LSARGNLEEAVTESEITIAILKDIRDAVRGTNDRIDTLDKNLSSRIEVMGLTLSARIEATNERLDVTNERLSVVEHTVRDLATQLLMLGRYVKNRTEVAIEDLLERVARLEAKVG